MGSLFVIQTYDEMWLGMNQKTFHPSPPTIALHKSKTPKKLPGRQQG
jgi:hypothetical protein